jgi:hypothetical protein
MKSLAGHGRKPTRLRQQAIAALITQPTVELAARACNVSYSTLNRWLKDEQFTAEIAEARNQVLTAAIDKLKAASYDSVVFLQAVVNSSNAIEANRVNAAKFLVELALRVGAMEQLEQRIRELERMNNALPEDTGAAFTTLEGNNEQESGDSAGSGWASSAFEISLSQSTD